MERVVEIREHGIVVVHMGFGEHSVEARNLLAQIAHLVSYEGPLSKQIVFRIDAKSIRQAAEWGVSRKMMLKKLRDFSGQSPSRATTDCVHRQVWKTVKSSQEPGKYSSWLSSWPRFWDRLRIVQAFWALRGFGKPLNQRSLPTSLRPAVHKHGGWLLLVSYAGFNAEEEGVAIQQFKWTKQLVRRQLQNLKHLGYPLNASWLQKHGYGRLWAAARRAYGSLGTAIQAAGYDPANEWRGVSRRLSAEEVVREILRRKAHGESVSSKVRLYDYNLWVSAMLYFANWPNALRAAGVDPKEVMLTRWSPEIIIRSLQEIKGRGEPINMKYLRIHYPKLERAIAHHFGVGAKAVEAAGYDPAQEVRQPTHTPEELLKQLTEIKKRGEPINTGYLQKHYPYLDAGLRRYWGSWEEGVRAAGYAPDEERIAQSWSREKVIETLRKMAAQGEPLTWSYILRTAGDHRLRGAIHRYFGTLRAAREAAQQDE